MVECIKFHGNWRKTERILTSESVLRRLAASSITENVNVVDIVGVTNNQISSMMCTLGVKVRKI